MNQQLPLPLKATAQLASGLKIVLLRMDNRSDSDNNATHPSWSWKLGLSEAKDSYNIKNEEHSTNEYQQKIYYYAQFYDSVEISYVSSPNSPLLNTICMHLISFLQTLQTISSSQIYFSYFKLKNNLTEVHQDTLPLSYQQE